MKKLVLVLSILFATTFSFANTSNEIIPINQAPEKVMDISPSDCWDIAEAIADNLYGGDFDVFVDRYNTCLTLC